MIKKRVAPISTADKRRVVLSLLGARRKQGETQNLNIHRPVNTQNRKTNSGFDSRQFFRSLLKKRGEK